MQEKSINAQFGNIDIYLFDQLLKGRFDACKSILDVGCGNGRNLTYFLQNDFEVWGVDENPKAVEYARALATNYVSGMPPERFQVAKAENLPFDAPTFDLVICNAVLHFAANQSHFEAMLHGCWSALNPGGYFFGRLASSIGIEDRITLLGDGQYQLPDGSQRYLVSEQDLLNYGSQLNGHLFEPIKTTNVQNLRCMTTWCLQKS